MLRAEGLQAVLPLESVQSVEDGVALYRQYYAEQQEHANGVLAIHVQALV